MTIDLVKLLSLDPTLTLRQFAAFVAATECSLGMQVTARGLSVPKAPEVAVPERAPVSVAVPATVAPSEEPILVPPFDEAPVVSPKAFPTPDAVPEPMFNCRGCGRKPESERSGGPQSKLCKTCKAASQAEHTAKMRASVSAKWAKEAPELDDRQAGDAKLAAGIEATADVNTLTRAELRDQRRALAISLEALSYRSGVSLDALSSLSEIGERLHPDDERRVVSALEWARSATNQEKVDLDLAYRRDQERPSGMILGPVNARLG